MRAPVSALRNLPNNMMRQPEQMSAGAQQAIQTMQAPNGLRDANGNSITQQQADGMVKQNVRGGGSFYGAPAQEYQGERLVSDMSGATASRTQSLLAGGQPQGAASPQTMAQPQAPYQPAPTGGSQNYGLAGAEQAYAGGLTGGLEALQGATQQGLDALQSANTFGQNQMQQGTNNALNSLRQGMGASQSMVNQGMSALGGNFSGRASNVDQNIGQSQFNQAAQGVGAYAGGGLQSQQQQLALSGVQGQEAFNNAMMNNPGTKYLQDEMMRNVTNQGSATGNVVSGNILRELQDRSAGIAAQDLDNQFNRAFQSTGQGLQAAGQQGQFLAQAGQQQGNLAAQNAQMQTQASLQNASNRLGAAQSQASLAGNQANNLSDLFGQGAGYQQATGLNSSNLAAALSGRGADMMGAAGNNAATLYQNAGQALGGARSQAGRDLANQINQSSGAMAGYAADQGAGLENIFSEGGVNIANIMQNSGNLSAEQKQQLATILSNLAVGEGSQNSNAIGNAGQSQVNAAIAQGANNQQLIGNLAGAYGYYQGNQPAPLVTPGTGNGIGNQQFINNVNAGGW